MIDSEETIVFGNAMSGSLGIEPKTLLKMPHPLVSLFRSITVYF